MVIGLADQKRVTLNFPAVDYYVGILFYSDGTGYAVFNSVSILSDTTTLGMSVITSNSGKTVEYVFTNKWFRGFMVIGGYTAKPTVTISGS